MRVLIFERSDLQYLGEDNRESLTDFDIDIEYTDRLDPDNQEKLESDDKVHEFVTDVSSLIISANLIIIHFDNTETPLRLANHLRLTDITSEKPILIVGNEAEIEVHRLKPDLARILLTKGTTYYQGESLENGFISSNIDTLNRELVTLYKDSDSRSDGLLKKLLIPAPDRQGRHSIANQWGAYRMAQVADLDMSIFRHPKTLYFKYLLAQSVNPSPKKLAFPIVKKVLFIDDNYDKGWSACLEAFFGESAVKSFKSWKGAKEYYEEKQEGIFKDFEQRIIDDEFDLIFLDFYLGEEDRIGFGKDLLQIIKGKENDGLNPVVPVIMFTASNKAWNMDELYEAGADGYYVKEHPETAYDPEFSVKNLENFHKTIKKCSEKGELLRLYWRKIREIRKSEFIQNKIDSLENEQKNKERIHERLIMFLGLLKKAYEQTDFDQKTFFYSDWELAFLTLWSTLNEIQEAYYEKTQPELSLLDSSGNRYSNHYGKNRHQPITYLKSPYKNHFKWMLNDKIFIDYTYKLDEDLITKKPIINYDKYKILGTQKSTLLFDKKSQSYNTTELIKTEVDFETTLHVQIAFLLIKMDSKLILLTNLANLNSKVRNKLYLTHGDDSSSSNFHVEYRSQRKSDQEWQRHIEQLFEIVYFLCTGVQVN